MVNEKQEFNPEKKSQTTSYVQKLSLMAGSVSALYMLPSAANAAIINNTSSFDVTIQDTIGGSIEWDIDSGGTFEASFAYASGWTAVDFGVSFASNSGNFRFGFAPLGQSVGQYFASNSGLSGTFSVITTDDVFNGLIADGDTEYMVFQFADDTDGEIKHGWASLTAFINNDLTTGFTINEWAYESTPGAAITVGDTGENQSTPEPASTLALLSMGAAGVYRWRKRKKLLAEAEKKAA